MAHLPRSQRGAAGSSKPIAYLAIPPRAVAPSAQLPYRRGGPGSEPASGSDLDGYPHNPSATGGRRFDGNLHAVFAKAL